MRTQLLKYWHQIRTSFWFLPSLMAAGAVGLAFATVALDESLTDKWRQTLGWTFTSQAEGASAVLQTIAGSMITIAGVVFSLTLVALSLASSQFGPRLLRNFMRDTANQLAEIAVRALSPGVNDPFTPSPAWTGSDRHCTGWPSAACQAQIDATNRAGAG